MTKTITIQGTTYTIERWGDDYILIGDTHQVVIPNGYIDLKSDCERMCQKVSHGESWSDPDEVSNLMDAYLWGFVEKNYSRGLTEND